MQAASRAVTDFWIALFPADMGMRMRSRSNRSRRSVDCRGPSLGLSWHPNMISSSRWFARNSPKSSGCAISPEFAASNKRSGMEYQTVAFILGYYCATPALAGNVNRHANIIQIRKRHAVVRVDGGAQTNIAKQPII